MPVSVKNKCFININQHFPTRKEVALPPCGVLPPVRQSTGQSKGSEEESKTFPSLSQSRGSPNPGRLAAEQQIFPRKHPAKSQVYEGLGGSD